MSQIDHAIVLKKNSYMLAGIEALEAKPRVQIERVQQYMPAFILELWFLIGKEIRPSKEFTQKVRDILVLLLDDIAVVVELVDGIRITIGSHLIGFKSSCRLSFCAKFLFLLLLCFVTFSQMFLDSIFDYLTDNLPKRILFDIELKVVQSILKSEQ